MKRKTSTIPSSFVLDPLLQHRITTISRGDEDTAQAIALRLLELAHAEPTFAAQQPGFLIKRAAWESRHVAEKSQTYDRYVTCEPQMQDEQSGEWVGVFDEYVAADVATPEETLLCRERMARLESAIEALPDTQRQVVRLLTAFHQPSEIAEQLGMSRSSVSQAIARARAALATVEL